MTLVVTVAVSVVNRSVGVNNAVTVSDPAALIVRFPEFEIVIAPPFVAEYVNVPGLFETGSGEITVATSPTVFAIVGTQVKLGITLLELAEIITVLEAGDLALIPAAL